jgi:hypothetical protein
MVRTGICFVVVLLIKLTFVVSPLHAQEPDAPTAVVAPETSAETPAAKTDKRLFGVLPNYRTVDASIPFMPLSPRQKLSIASHDSFDWPTYVLAGVLTFATPGKDQGGYGGGLSGFANRYVRSSADQITGNMLTEGFLPALLRQDPRYFRPGTGSFGSRLGSALSQIVVARNDAGHRTFNTSEFLGNAMAVGISNAYSSNLNSWSHRSEKLLLMISTDTFSNVVKEFGPDIRQRLPHRRHTT